MNAPTLETPAAPTLTPSRAEQSAATAAHARLNIPLNLDNWRSLPEETTAHLLWFHQYALDEGMSLPDCAEALGYDGSTVFRVLKGTYEGSWKNICSAIASYRKLVETRGTIQQNEFAPMRLSKLVFGGLDYALANCSITTITGESRSGKTLAAEEWCRQNNHGRSVFVRVPSFGGVKVFLRAIAEKIGVSRSLPTAQLADSIFRAFNKNRILILDEAHRMLAADPRTPPVMLEFARDIRDVSGAAIALIATANRWEKSIKASEYMFEQVLGRIGMPVRLPRNILGGDIEPIVRQYIARPGAALMSQMLEVANKPGRLGILVEILKVASRIAKKKNEKLADQHVFTALKVRSEMQGGL